MKADSAMLKKFRSFAESLGIRVSNRDSDKSWSWNGKTLALVCEGEPRDIDVLYHDVAHWLVCPTERRSKPDFGLGKDVNDSGRNASLLVSEESINIEEREASILGIAMEHRAGLDWAKTLKLHEWLAPYTRPAALPEVDRIAKKYSELIRKLDLVNSIDEIRKHLMVTTTRRFRITLDTTYQEDSQLDDFIGHVRSQFEYNGMIIAKPAGVYATLLEQKLSIEEVPSI